MKKAGGHGLEEHVGKTNDELILRAMRSEIGAASSYPNKSIAIKAVKENLRNNAEDIAQWLKNDAANPKISFDFTHKYPIGSGVLQGKKVPVYDLTKSKVFLKKDPTQDLGFKIVTTFPICN